MKKFEKYGVCVCIAAMLTLTAAGAHAEERRVIPMGSAVGIDMKTDGVLVAGLTEVSGGTEASPAAKAGVCAGDVIVELAGQEINCAQDLTSAVSTLTGEAVELKLISGVAEKTVSITPNITENGPELGMWLRDGVSGVGTLTFYDTQTGMFAGLGHAINDTESGVIIPLGSGSIFRATVAQVKKGCAGVPGELCGVFDLSSPCGELLKNTPFGIYGAAPLSLAAGREAMPVAQEGEITLGEATILANVDGSSVESYDVEIERVYHGDCSGRSMMLSVTDPVLLEKTGGIVQGMSGSPIIQNGRIIGAVTHVMINDPQRGFGISAELMLEQCASQKQSIIVA